MPMGKVINEHEQLVALLNQLMDERDILARENGYLKAKMNESLLIETMNEMKKERDFLYHLLANLTTKYESESRIHSVRPTSNGQSTHYAEPSVKSNSTVRSQTRSSTSNHGNSNRVKANHEPTSKVIYRTANRQDTSMSTFDRIPSSSLATLQVKPAPTGKRILVQKTTQPQEYKHLFRKADVPLKHSLYSPFQNYRSQSLQNLA